MAHAGFPKGLGTTPDEIVKKIANDSDEKGRRLIIEFHGRSIGEMSYRNIGNNTAEIGIKICEADCQGKGLGRIILIMFIKELFSMGFTKIALDTNLKNLKAQHIYELLGFQKIKVNYNSWKDQLGEWQSSVDYELIFEHFRDYSVNRRI